MRERSGRLQAFGNWKLSYVPGTQAQFHLTSAGWVLAEIVERRTNISLSEFLRREIAVPLGLSFELGVPIDRQAVSVAPMVATDHTDSAGFDPWGPWALSDPAFLEAGEPSHGVVATAADVALHYQALLSGDLWSPETIAEATRIRVSTATDAYGGGSANLGLFVLVHGRSEGGLLPACSSASTFGCPGQACQIGFVDPEVGLSFAFLTNGYPRASPQQRADRNRATIIGNLAADLVA
jgi:CubicO group peptidase (beta-lactamase class C family)